MGIQDGLVHEIVTPPVVRKRVRLVKVICQPVLVIDDGDTLLEQVAEPIAVPASELGAFPERLAADLVAHEQQVNAEPEDG